MRHPIRLLAVAVLAAAACPALAMPGAAAPGVANLPFREAVFAATHNSYSGNIGGDRGDLTTQLDRGVRQLELDLHLVNGRFEVGDDGPGDAVYHGGTNPKTNALPDWLLTIKKWSAQHPEAAPITLVLAMHSNLNTDQGVASVLVDDLTENIGADRLARLSPKATVDDLRGKIIPVLSGRMDSRLAYLRDQGVVPAVAVNSHGQVVEVHDSGHGTLWYWIGQWQADNTVRWLSHGRYDTGTNPAVALTDSGMLVEVHQSEHAKRLFYRLGQIDSTGGLRWRVPSTSYGDGERPSLLLTGPSTVNEIHRTDTHPVEYLTRTGQIGQKEIRWSGLTITHDHGHPTDWGCTAASRCIEVRTGGFSYLMEKTLQYRTNVLDDSAWQRVIYPQIMATEVQYDDSKERRVYPMLLLNSTFAAAPADRGVAQTTWMNDVRDWGHPLREWAFAQDSQGLPIPNFPSTDHPYATWYLRYLERRPHYVS
ncbi:MAG: phosphatidylinositol-specific phospholipase C domain-containing protein [Hamadaea sp.]|nr:phosphatidylinositol-specific phospholipase C domain-containing protein [Hamadaea sp.]